MINNLELIRNTSAGNLLENILVSSVSTILITRFFLFITGYPQIGRGGLHFAHVLWGGVLMLLSLIVLLSFLGRKSRIIGSIVGGIGFGLFIDELGKFITRDNNYFYEPAAALIYLVFVGLFFLFRYIENHKPLTEKEYLMNALVLLEEAVQNDLDKEEKTKYQKLLENAGNYHYLTKELLSLTDNLTIQKAKSGSFMKFLRQIIKSIDNFIQSNHFQKIIIAVFILQLVIAVLTIFFLGIFELKNIPSFFFTFPQKHIFASWGEFISILISAVLSFAGLLLLRFSKQRAYMLFKHSLLISVLITSFFSFYRLQFAALIGLGINVLLLIGVNNMLAKLTAKDKKTKSNLSYE